jgi:hypothetical protein
LCGRTLQREQFSSGPEVPDSGQCAFFHAGDERIPKTEDSLAERGEFELLVPSSEQPDENMMSVLPPGRRVGIA